MGSPISGHSLLSGWRCFYVRNASFLLPLLPSLPRSNSFSSRRASLLSRRSCLSISSLIRRASFASSLRQHAIIDSRVIVDLFFFSFSTQFRFLPSYWVIQISHSSGRGLKIRGLWMSKKRPHAGLFSWVKTRVDALRRVSTRSRLRWRREYLIFENLLTSSLSVSRVSVRFTGLFKTVHVLTGCKAVFRLNMINRSF